MIYEAKASGGYPVNFINGPNKDIFGIKIISVVTNKYVSVYLLASNRKNDVVNPH